MSFKSELPEWRYRLISQNVDVRRPVCPPPKKKITKLMCEDDDSADAELLVGRWLYQDHLPLLHGRVLGADKEQRIRHGSLVGWSDF